MRQYIRYRLAGGCYFFTVVLARRTDQYLVDHAGALRAAFRKVKLSHPFRLDALVVLLDHLHCVWTLPEGDDDFPTRWFLIKSSFSRALPQIELRSESRMRKEERGIWQRRYWEHAIRDDLDHQRHIDYIHYNPVKHGYVKWVADWQYSTFHRYVRLGIYPPDWAGGREGELDGSRIE
ncbi:MAG TPA: transposase [Candidatus Binatia bacterium]|nr:transposase [Candidatus Binatia bacterium]